MDDPEQSDINEAFRLLEKSKKTKSMDTVLFLLQMNTESELFEKVFKMEWFKGMWDRFRDYIYDPEIPKDPKRLNLRTIAEQNLRDYRNMAGHNELYWSPDYSIQTQKDAHLWLCHQLIQRLSNLFYRTEDLQARGILGVVKLVFSLRDAYAPGGDREMAKKIDEIVGASRTYPWQSEIVAGNTPYVQVDPSETYLRLDDNGNLQGVGLLDFEDPYEYDHDGSITVGSKSYANYDLPDAFTSQEHQSSVGTLVAKLEPEARRKHDKCQRLALMGINHIKELEDDVFLDEGPFNFTDASEIEAKDKSHRRYYTYEGKSKTSAKEESESQDVAESEMQDEKDSRAEEVTTIASLLERAQQAIGTDEAEENKQNSEVQEGFADAGISLTDACKMIGIDPEAIHKRVSGMEMVWTLKHHQIVGAAWIRGRLHDRLDNAALLGCLLCDTMGLGKTITIMASILGLMNERQARVQSHTERVTQKSWRGGPHLIIVPANVFHTWERSLQSFSHTWHLIFYRAGNNMPDLQGPKDSRFQTKDINRTILLTTYDIWTKRHGNDQRFKSYFQVVWADEAHMLRSFSQKNSSARSKAVMNLKPFFFVGITGTPICYEAKDIQSLMQYTINSQKVEQWISKHTWKPDWNLFRRGAVKPADRWMWRSKHAMEHIFKKDKERNWAELLKSAVQPVILRRSPASIVNGVAIGEDIPPRAVRQGILKGTQYQRRLIKNGLLQENPDLIERPNSVKFTKELVRVTAHITTFTEFKNLSLKGGPDAHKAWKVVEHPSFDTKGQHFGRVLKELFQYIKEKDPGCNFPGLDLSKAHPGDIQEYIVRRSPKLQYLTHDIDIKVICQRRKVVIWTQWPWIQLLVTAYIRSLGVDAHALHSGLSQDQRDILVDRFNERKSDNSVLVCSYDVSSEGINLDKKCGLVVCFELAESSALQEQAMYRIIRMTQDKPQIVTIYTLIGSLDVNRQLMNMSKDHVLTTLLLSDNKEPGTGTTDQTNTQANNTKFPGSRQIKQTAQSNVRVADHIRGKNGFTEAAGRKSAL
ncbi:hypothetical protein BT63DRAFT_459775 [Microthyrium microscopicum]|uniref:Helicase ATP-binding domain-containing protein n=1 Tax=Microthyrium microscopicum TaxID=703497 RepID=A0A6A6TYI1_9PEZI|nr:hypothetical protein BT63DRAFT_459775 [Microthyrium microscopicum]